ncbi:Hypothetical protein CINCED_3A014594 [Cinara cedri]|uniref:Uncharacterized protein n=1 Tax=Cinara cedri TaxID=506608 RepID=A0A5E4NL87_9HEMI|nr:Hypothetical protein CINCED_3A014594 [Cinara cedri]
MLKDSLFIFFTFCTTTNKCIAYDCGGSQVNITSFNSLEKAETQPVYFQTCFISIDYLITSCSVFEDAQMVDGGFFSEIIELGTARCKEIHQHRVYHTPLGNIISGLKINQTTLVPHTSGGALDREGNCEEGIATANNKENILILPSGSRLKLSDSYGLDQYKGGIVWQIEHQECNIREFDVLYDGEASLVKATTYNSNTESFIVETNHTAISLKKLSLSYACNIPVYKTDNPQLLIIADQNYADSFTPKQITPFSADLLSYLNTKFVYLEFTVKRTTTKLLIINTTI